MTESPFRVRPADLEAGADAEAVLQLLDAYAADPMGDGEPLPESTRQRLIPALRKIPERLVLLAFLDKRAIGLAIAFQGFSTFRAMPLLNVHDLAVLPEFRGRGVGSALLAGLEAEARQRGCCKMTLEVRADNSPANALYRRRGFAAAVIDDQEIQYLFLEKKL